MAEFENQDLDNDLDLSNNETDYEEDNTSEEDSPTYEDYLAVKKRLAKAEKTLVEYKKKAKTSNWTTWEVVTKQDLELIRFIDKNPWYEWKEDEIKKYLSKWLGLSEIKRLVEPDDTFDNREKTKTTSITAWEYISSQNTYTISELEKLSQSEYEKVMTLVENWKASIR
jgi:hypothetical protein